MKASTNTDTPKDRTWGGDFYRFDPRFELREDDGGSHPRLTGYMARFNEPTLIQSIFEGEFIERIAPGAFKKTLKEQRKSIRILLNHGRGSTGEDPIALPELVEDERGVRYDDPELFEGIPPLVISGLRAGQYGSSFKFTPTREEFIEEPKPSDVNPDGIPERIVREVRLYEGGPVTFPAYEGATAGVRSTTDLYREFKDDELLEMQERAILLNPERARHVLDQLNEQRNEPKGDDAEVVVESDNLPNEAPEVTHSEGAEVKPHSAPRRGSMYGSRPKKPTWQLPKE